MKYLLNPIRCFSSSWLVSHGTPPDFLTQVESDQCQNSPLMKPMLTKVMAAATVPVLMLSGVAETAEAWETEASLAQPETRTVLLNVSPVINHQIEEGDTLWKLGQRYELSTEEIAEYNGMQPQQLLQVGDTIEIPVKQEFLPQTPQLLPSSLGAIGGSIASTPLVFDTLTEDTFISPVPRVVKQNQPSITPESQPLLSEAPIQEFLADVKQLRENYEKETVSPGANRNLDWNRDSASHSQGKVFSPVENSSRSASPNSLATAPIKVEFYNPSLSVPIGETVSPQLPPLSSPEQYLPNHPQKFNGYIWPAEGVFTSGYGMRWGRMHRGIDIAAPIGTPILAAAPGEVVVAGWSSGGYGNLVKLKHPDGSLTLYAHNNKLLVHKGQEVDQGQQIAEMGSTGRSTGPHLHFEIHPSGKGARNPLAYLPKR